MLFIVKPLRKTYNSNKIFIKGNQIIKDKQGQDRGLEAYRRFLDGDENALEELIGIYREGLTLFIDGIVGDARDAEELMMDTFARFAVKGKRYEGRASMKTYLYAIGRNLALRHLKRHSRDKLLSLDDGQPAPDAPETALLRDEENRLLYEALGQLKADYRETLYLLYFEEMSYAEAARVLNKTERQISDLAYRGKAALKAIMESGIDDTDE